MSTKKLYSFIDPKGRTFYDCAECDRGGNGESKQYCVQGRNIKRGRVAGCFQGIIIPALNKYLQRRGV